jgi:photosystem II stability/assembly factor-like uncharacterized protein
LNNYRTINHKKTSIYPPSFLFSVPFYAQYWEPKVSGVSANLNHVFCITEDNVIIVGTGGTILKTTDGGEHWNQKIRHFTYFN